MDVGQYKIGIQQRRMVDVLMNPKLYADLVLKDGWVVNVITREIYQADVAIAGDRILKVGQADDLIGPATRVENLPGCYIVPGMIDSHMHFESSMLTISEFSRLSIPSGTTTLVADPHEIANALGPAGIKAMAREAQTIPNRVYLAVPALTPDCPGLETAGYDMTSADMPEVLQYPAVIGIGELQGFSNARFVYQHTPELITDLIASCAYARSLGKTVDGNAPELFGSELAAHVIAGGGDISCHETTTKAECIEKLRYGVSVFMREGSTQKNMAECIRAVTEDGLDSRKLIGATDDMIAEDLIRRGHMNQVAARIVSQGIDPVEALQMVTINPATHFGLKDVGVLAPGKLADIVVLEDLRHMKALQVYIGGRLAAKQGRMVLPIPRYTYPETVKHSVRREPVNASDLEIRASGNRPMVRVIGLIPDQNLTESHELEMTASDGVVTPDLSRDVLPIAVVERYGRNGNIGRAFVTGFGLRLGAMAESVSHDAHNIIVTGASYQDMALAVNRVITMGGGVALVKEGQVLGELRLPIGGLMTDELDGYQLSACLNELQRLAAAELGCKVHAPFMHLSFLALTTSPKWKITDCGLVDVNQFCIIDPVKEK